MVLKYQVHDHCTSNISGCYQPLCSQCHRKFLNFMGQRDQNITHNKFIRSLHYISISTFHSEININRLTQYMIRCFQILTCLILLTCFQILICIIFLTYSEIIILIIYIFLVVHVHCPCTLNMGSCCNTF